MSKTIRIGSGAGYSGDRISPAVELAKAGNIQYLVFECLAERTIALAQQAKMKNPDTGFDPMLEERMLACLPVCKKNNIKIITNMGAANPLAGLNKILEVSRTLGIHDIKIVAITGDDVLENIKNTDATILETGKKLNSLHGKIISANAYLGAQPIVEALQMGADIIITGRVSDPALFVAPLIFEFGWSMQDYNRLGQATVLGHLLECAGQITGGYFADPGFKDVPDLNHLGFPIAEMQEDGSFIITKAIGSGGMVTTGTCKEQLLYEIHDPSAYITPDVIADFSGVIMKQIGKDCVQVTGGEGKEKTGMYKVSIGYLDSYIGEGQISYGGPGAVERGKLALNIVKERMNITGIACSETRFDLIGVNSLYGNKISRGEPFEVRARVAARTGTLSDAIKIGNEVETLYTNGPAGGGGVFKTAREVVAVVSILISSATIVTKLHLTAI